MGTYGCRREKGIKDIVWFQQEMGWEKDNGTYCRILDSGRKGNVVYLQMEVKTTEELTRFILVCVTTWKKNEYFNFYYKPMDEDMGPYYWDCPLRLLDNLTPPKTETARKWREKVRELHANKSPILKIGQTVKFDNTIAFTDGFSGDTFEVMKYGKRGKSFLAIDNGRQYKITNVRRKQFTVLSE